MALFYHGELISAPSASFLWFC